MGVSATRDEAMVMLDRANAVRSVHAVVKREVESRGRDGATYLADLIERGDPRLARARTGPMLDAVWMLGDIKIGTILSRCGVAHGKRIGAYSERQREAIVRNLRTFTIDLCKNAARKDTHVKT